MSGDLDVSLVCHSLKVVQEKYEQNEEKNKILFKILDLFTVI